MMLIKNGNKITAESYYKAQARKYIFLKLMENKNLKISEEEIQNFMVLAEKNTNEIFAVDGIKFKKGCED